jgi:hypothetical protein
MLEGRLESPAPQPRSEYTGRTSTSVNDEPHHGISSASDPITNDVAAGASLTPRSTVRRRPSALSGTARVHMLATDGDNESDLDSLLVGLIASPLAEDSPETQHSIGGQSPRTSQLKPLCLWMWQKTYLMHIVNEHKHSIPSLIETLSLPGIRNGSIVYLTLNVLGRASS